MKNYIPAELWKDSYKSPQMQKSFTFVEKVPLSRIKIDKRLFSFQNDVSASFVNFIVENFDKDFWMPVLVNADFFLLDGQHRIQVAKKLGLKYIDVAIVKEQSL